MARSNTDKAIAILGLREVAETVKKPQAERRSKKITTAKKAGSRRSTHKVIRGGKDVHALAVKAFVKSHGEPKMWTEVIRSGLPSASLKRTADLLGVSVNELSKILRLPARTVYR